MPNTNIYTDKVAAKIVRRVKNKLNVASTFTKKFELEFEDKSDPIGQTLRVKKPLRGRIVDGLDWVGGDSERIYTTVGPFETFHVEFQNRPSPEQDCRPSLPPRQGKFHSGKMLLDWIE